jgi:hypothetical protein
VVVVVVVVLEGALVPPPQAAVNAPIAMIATAAAIAGRRAKRTDLMMDSYLAMHRFAVEGLWDNTSWPSDTVAGEHLRR